MATNTRKLADLLANIDDNSKVTTGGLLDATITAADLADDSVGAAEIIDDAVTNAAIADGAIDTAAKLGSNVVTSAKVADNAVTGAKIAADAIEVKPHIKPGILHPAIAGKLLDGTTSHSGAYGTAQSDGRSYYYTDIKGSRAIKDPRIGAYFGSQRHKFKSLQLLEHETAADSSNVYSVDGREWIRVKGDKWEAIYNLNGTFIENSVGSVATDSHFIEIVGYFNDAHIIHWLSGTGNDLLGVTVNGGTKQANDYAITVASPLLNRGLDTGSVLDLTFNSPPTLGINTLKISNTSGAYLSLYGIELIAQDIQDFTATNATNILTSAGHTLSNGDQVRLTGADLPNGLNATTTYFVVGASGNNFQVSGTSGGSAVTFSDDGTGSRTFTALNNIQIPAQTVISYGKKFSISATAHHYDPFNGFTNSSGTAAGLHSTYVDTATSLGLDTAPGSSAKWAISGTNNIRPYNGGRVVKWIASDGTIKTSVNMMPPNAQGIGNNANNGSAGIAAAEIATPSATNTAYLPAFSDDVIDNSLAEVATKFRHIEFGNGSANGGSGSSYKDFTIVMSASDIERGWVMDDGLTSLGGRVRGTYSGMYPDDTNDKWRMVFIGTGLSVTGLSGTRVHFQNLPYGTHIVQFVRAASTGDSQWSVDGVNYRQQWGSSSNEDHAYEFTYHQPKMPPIPEDACIIADYMLMADYVKATGVASDRLSKGVRMVSSSRDMHHDTESTAYGAITHDNVYPQATSGIYTTSNPNVGHNKCKLPGFGTQMEINSYAHRGDIFVDGTDMAQTEIGSADETAILTQNDASPLGAHIFESRNSSSNHNVGNLRIVTPIHTSFHYQPFETPFLKELVGGDRNMEQHNLIVTPDGKSWDEVTRDTSYIGNGRVSAASENDTWIMNNDAGIFDEMRGDDSTALGAARYNKDFAIGNDMFVCLVDGNYKVYFRFLQKQGDHVYIRVNGANVSGSHHPYADGASTSYGGAFLSENLQLKRGDYVQTYDLYHGGLWSHFYIEKL